MFVDVQVTFADEIKREAAVFSDLFEHVIEETEASGDMNRTLALQVYVYDDFGLFRLACYRRLPRCLRKLLSDSLPTVAARNTNARHAKILCQFHVRVAIANHEAARSLDGCRAQEFGE